MVTQYNQSTMEKSKSQIILRMVLNPEKCPKFLKNSTGMKMHSILLRPHLSTSGKSFFEGCVSLGTFVEMAIGSLNSPVLLGFYKTQYSHLFCRSQHFEDYSS